MSIIKIYSEENSAELNTFLAEIKPHVDNYLLHRNAAQKERMQIIGQACEFKDKFPQRSSDHRKLMQAMQSEWSADVIHSNAAAYKEYKRLKETEVDEYVELAEAANPSQLKTLSRGVGTTLAFDAAKHLQKMGQVPSKGRMEQHLQGRSTPSFETRTVPGRNSEETQPIVAEPVTPIVTPELSPEEEKFNLDCNRLNIRFDYRSTVKTRIESEGLKHIDDVMSSYYHGGGVKENAMACMKVVLQHLERSNPDTEIVELLLNAAAAIKSKDNTSSDVVTVVEVKAAETVFDGKERNGVRWRR